MDNFIIYNTDDGQAKVSLLACESLQILQQLISKPFRARSRYGLHSYYFPTYCKYSQLK